MTHQKLRSQQEDFSLKTIIQSQNEQKQINSIKLAEQYKIIMTVSTISVTTLDLILSGLKGRMEG